jgi:hypothetical protein
LGNQNDANFLAELESNLNEDDVGADCERVGGAAPAAIAATTAQVPDFMPPPPKKRSSASSSHLYQNQSFVSCQLTIKVFVLNRQKRSLSLCIRRSRPTKRTLTMPSY